MAVVTTGFFDGVHLGHRQVIETVVSAARERGVEATVVTFWPHPRAVLQQDARELRLLNSLEEKRERLLALGIDRVQVLPFTREFAALTAVQYLQLLQERFGAQLVVMGYDNRIGCDRKSFAELADGELEILACGPAGQGIVPQTCVHPRPHKREGPNRRLGGVAKRRFEVLCPAPQREISSTFIRERLAAGDIAAANAMLGYAYELYGVVVAGNRLGRTIGFPTANMRLYEPLKLIPAAGVYAVEVETLGSTWRGMCNIGTRPTVGGSGLTVETHILDFDQDIYGLPLRVRFLRRIRDERRFPSLEALREQLLLDAAICRL